MAETKKKGRKRNKIGRRQTVDTAISFAQHVRSGGLKTDLRYIKVITNKD